MSRDDKAPAQPTLGMWRRIVAAVRWVEAQVDARASTRRTPTTFGLVRALSTTTISEGSFFELGTGEAQIYHFDQESGEWEESGDPVDVINQYGGGDIAPRTALTLAWVSGFWMVDTAACAPEPEEEGEG